MTDFLLELRSEEIPARMQVKAKDDLVRLFTDALAKAGLAAESLETFSTPRRLALIAKGLPLETEAVAEETKGPKVGAPPQALEGFLRKVGLSEDQLVERDGVFFAVVNKPGRKTADVLAEAIPAIIRAFPWPKSQRWGAASISTESLRWVRPLQGIVALLGHDVVPCRIEGISSGRETMGHRFHSTGPVSIANAATYVETLRAANVIVHFSERCRIIRDGAQADAKAAGLVLVEDEGLVAENAGLTEWPVPMLGRFDSDFLAVPQEVIQLTARVNQKYFVCHDSAGKLANAFVCTANIVAHDGGAAIVAGNEKVLAARLSDAKFFWEQDLKIPLDEQAKKLAQITFHEKLGTVADKVERVAKLARWLVEEGIVKPSPLQRRGLEEGAVNLSAALSNSPPSPVRGASRTSPGDLSLHALEGERELLADQAERAARLCKADLVTGMVGEFPELQGLMGGYYARAQGEADAVSDAVRDHYKPVGQGDDVPSAPVTVAVSLADKLDTLFAFFIIGEKPTGSKDPFALRRSALGILALLVENNVRLPFFKVMPPAFEAVAFSLGKVYGFRRTDLYIRFLTDLGLTQDERSALLDKFIEDDTLEKRDEIKRVQKEAESLAMQAPQAIGDFMTDRLKVQQREAGVRHDLIDAVFALGGEDDLVRLLARVKALQAFVATDEGVNLLAGYKRAANILKQAETSSPSTCDGEGDRAEGVVEGTATSKAPPSALRDATSPSQVDGEELALLTALDTAEPLAIAAIEAEDFESAMAALASLRAPIDAFFDGVMVNDPDPEKRAFRIGLLTRFRDAVHRVADFSRIEG
jgi:glycyl-tRNA synthetase beta chain